MIFQPRRRSLPMTRAPRPESSVRWRTMNDDPVEPRHEQSAAGAAITRRTPSRRIAFEQRRRFLAERRRYSRVRV